MTAQEAFQHLYEIVVKLRAPEGCPWDREQTPSSLRRHLLEETYECIEAIESKSPADIEEELGDLYMLVTMLGRIYEEQGVFSVAAILDTVSQKLVRRHPHVFGDDVVESADEVVDQWQRIKTEQEGKRARTGHLDSVSRALPALERAYKLQRRASKVGFDWPSLSGVRDKLHEEIDEVIAEASSGSTPALDAARRSDDTASAELEQEVGDMLFSAVNLARYLGVDPSTALNRTNNKFVERFHYVEKEMQRLETPMTEDQLELMDRIWNEAKDQ
ncbi:MAG: nucleoside triphosphate pyrophosphohydrolase [Spirochaetota bacterium]